MGYNLRLNLQNLQIDQAAKYRWSDPTSGAAHEGVTLTDGTQAQGFHWTDQTLQRIDLPEVMKAEVKKVSTLDQAFKATAEALNSELKSTLDQAPDSNSFDYQKIKESQTLSFE